MAGGEVESVGGRTEWTDGGSRDRERPEKERSPVSSRGRERSRDGGGDRHSDEELAPRRKSVVRRSTSEEYSDYSEEKDHDRRLPRREERRERESDRGRDRDRGGRRDVEVTEKSKGSVGYVELGGMERYSSCSDEDSEEEEEVVEGGTKMGRGMKPEGNRRHDSSEEGSEEDEIVGGTPTKKSRSRNREKSGRKHGTSGDENEDDGVVVWTPTKNSRGRKREKSRKHSDRKSSKRKHHRNRSDESDSDESESDEPSSSSSDISDTEDEAQREKERKRRKKRRRKEKKREQEREIRRKEKRKLKELKEKKTKSEKKKKKRENRAKKPITTSWGKYGILKDIDMWNKRPEFSAWLAEVKKVNMEVLSNWEEKQMFKEYMEDYNTATFPSKKYYNLDIYHRRKMMKARMKGMAKLVKVERTDFNDEEQRRLELRKEREQKKEEDVEALMRTMQSGMAQAMREQAQLREEMQYQFRLGNVEAAQAIQRRLDPDADKLAKM